VTSDYPAAVKFLINSTLSSQEAKTDQVQGLLSKKKVQLRKQNTLIHCETGHSSAFLKELRINCHHLIQTGLGLKVQFHICTEPYRFWITASLAGPVFYNHSLNILIFFKGKLKHVPVFSLLVGIHAVGLQSLSFLLITFYAKW